MRNESIMLPELSCTKRVDLTVGTLAYSANTSGKRGVLLPEPQFRHGKIRSRLAFILGVLLLLGGCSVLDPYDRDKIGFYNQCVEAEGYGLTGFTQFGPLNFGWLSWRRNLTCDESLRIREQGIYGVPAEPEPAKPRGAIVSSRQIAALPAVPVLVP